MPEHESVNKITEQDKQAQLVEVFKKMPHEIPLLFFTSPERYINRDERHRTNIPGIYSAGDVEGGYKQIVIAAGQGSEAALSIFEDLMNPYWKTKKSE